MTQQYDAATDRGTAVPESVLATLAGPRAPIVIGVDLADEGARIVVIDVPGGRLVSGSLLYSDVSSDAIDAALAEHLVAVGRVAQPVGDEWARELHVLAGRGRSRLVGSAGAFIMGEEHVRLFRVTRRDMEAATEPLVAALSAHIDETADAVMGGERPADLPVVLTAAHTRWPGLSALLTELRGRAVVTVEDVSWQNGAVVATPSAPSIPTVPVVPSATPHHGAAESADEGTGEGAEEGTDERADAGIADRAGAVNIRKAAPAATAPEDAVTEEIAITTGRPELDSDGSTIDAESRLAARERRAHSRQRWLLGGAVAMVLAILGTAVAVAFAQHTPEAEPPASAATTSDKSGGATSPSDPPEYADPADLVDARKPAVRYSTPPPPVTTSSTEQQRPAPHGQQRPRTQRPRLVIPIPGRPPIVIP